jgi:hypothetical protein
MSSVSARFPEAPVHPLIYVKSASSSIEEASEEEVLPISPTFAKEHVGAIPKSPVSPRAHDVAEKQRLLRLRNTMNTHLTERETLKNNKQLFRTNYMEKFRSRYHFLPGALTPSRAGSKTCLEN